MYLVIDPSVLYVSTVLVSALELVRLSLLISAYAVFRGGKSGLHRTRRQVIPGGREPTESAAESKPPKQRMVAIPMLPVRVKGCGKSAPRRWQHSTAW